MAINLQEHVFIAKHLYENQGNAAVALVHFEVESCIENQSAQDARQILIQRNQVTVHSTWRGLKSISAVVILEVAMEVVKSPANDHSINHVSAVP
ncbi:hypothetical protein TNCV_1874081 [Trichonephila clavipes]|nr:hypothetical protein TNCV_1874081 [Trichonephila clavipes]